MFKKKPHALEKSKVHISGKGKTLEILPLDHPPLTPSFLTTGESEKRKILSFTKVFLFSGKYKIYCPQSLLR
ncbi:hypothetical protein [Methanosarcina mazei]|uniref:hypothetical protein n=1 Tax=Methanosarcina mazei TaxID=2209 RepID=UPI00064F8E2C|nr:hypothetical protein [Methanosarcina mazei]